MLTAYDEIEHHTVFGILATGIPNRVVHVKRYRYY